MSAEASEPVQEGYFRALLLDDLHKIWKGCAEILTKLGFSYELPDNIDSKNAEIFAEWIEKYSESEKSSARRVLLMISELLNGIVLVSEIVNGRFVGRKVSDYDEVLVQLGLRIGYLSALLAYNRSKTLEKYIDSNIKMQKIADGPRLRIPLWVDSFAPIAAEFCAGKTSVTYGQLRRRAREWADDHRGRGEPWVLPQDDKSLNRGIKKLVKLGRLTIPGKDGGA